MRTNVWESGNEKQNARNFNEFIRRKKLLRFCMQAINMLFKLEKEK